ncbi:hypothetical protein [Paenibacillus sp. NPDC057934]|uniref:hypothetical protein n=1 Tax=Paenibacillus sp. NPDC057934 TaxID=3346282 RepID=UPI0036DE1A2A
MSITSGGLFLLNGLSVVGVLLWLASLGMGLYAFVLFVKLDRRGIQHLICTCMTRRLTTTDPGMATDCEAEAVQQASRV